MDQVEIDKINFELNLQKKIFEAKKFSNNFNCSGY